VAGRKIYKLSALIGISEDIYMNIAFATPYYISGFGIENRVTELARNLTASRKKIICLRQGRPSPRGIKVVQLPMRLHQFTTRSSLHFSRLSKLIRNSFYSYHLRDADVVDAQYFPMTSLPKSSKFIITWHSVTFPEYAPGGYVEARIWNKEYRRMLSDMREADLVLPVSGWAEQEVKSFDSSIPTRVLPNGVDLTKFRFKPLEKRKKTILSVGRFTPHKGHAEVILILKKVLENLKYLNANLVLVGSMPDGDYLDSLKKYAESQGLKTNIKEDKQPLLQEGGKKEKPQVTFLTNVHDAWMPFVYQMGDIFVSCSHWEGFGMPMLEAQACGLPSLGYDICSHPEVAANRRFLAEENDIWAIAENVMKLLTDKRFYREEALRARKFAEGFSWERIAQLYSEVLGDV